MNDQTPIKRGRKFDQVLEGAREVFMADGFEGASVDTIAKRAGVSKATLYSYFPDKRLLFMEVASRGCGTLAEKTISEIEMSSPPPEVLSIVGHGMMNFMLSPMGQRVFRICVAESDRFPELGQRFWDSGPAMIEDLLVTYFKGAIDRGQLQIDDCSLAAHQFAELCKAMIFPRLVFGMQSSFPQDQVDSVIASAVDMFMARYGT